jgi:two-component system sensor histidine kinase CpxA
MRSLYLRILVTCVAAFLLSWAAFMVISGYQSSNNARHFHERLRAFELDQARRSYESGGPKQLAAYLSQLHRSFEADFYLLDGAGHDLADGSDRHSLFDAWRREHDERTALEKLMHWPHIENKRFVGADFSNDHRYVFVLVVPIHFNVLVLMPYFVLVVTAVGLVCWVLALQMVRPLRHLEAVVNRFGRGDLSARVNSKRRDEIGKLACSFDQMAVRTETLLTAERRLLQDIAHELRSPLARLSFAIELTRTAENRDGAVARLKKEVSRLNSLVGSLLEVTRAEGDPTSCRRQPVELSELLEEVVGDCRLEAAPRQCTIPFTPPATPLRADGDAELLRRATENVLRNAIRYAPPQSAVEVSLSTREGCAVVEVRDYGPGVKESELESIFVPFYRADDARSAETGGVGLGLAIAARAVRLHNGTIRAENANPGLRVSIAIPCLLQPSAD